MYYRFRLVDALQFRSVYEGDTPPPGSDPPNPDPGTNPPGNDPASDKSKVKFDPHQQAYVNSLLAQERRKLQTKNEELITQLETQKVQGSTTQAEKEALEERIESLRNEFATKEEMAKKDTDKRIKELEKSKSDAEKKATRNWEHYEKYRVQNDITQAAVQGKAFDPEQIVAILGPQTKVVEVTGEGGKPTGDYTTRVRLPGTNKEGQPITLDLSPPEAVKFLAEKPEKYGNLFISGATGGLGSTTFSGKTGDKPDPSKMSTEEYMKHRAEERKGKRPGQR